MQIIMFQNNRRPLAHRQLTGPTIRPLLLGKHRERGIFWHFACCTCFWRAENQRTAWAKKEKTSAKRGNISQIGFRREKERTNIETWPKNRIAVEGQQKRRKSERTNAPGRHTQARKQNWACQMQWKSRRKGEKIGEMCSRRDGASGSTNYSEKGGRTRAEQAQQLAAKSTPTAKFFLALQCKEDIVIIH